MAKTAKHYEQTIAQLKEELEYLYEAYEAACEVIEAETAREILGEIEESFDYPYEYAYKQYILDIADWQALKQRFLGGKQ